MYHFDVQSIRGVCNFVHDLFVVLASGVPGSSKEFVLVIYYLTWVEAPFAIVTLTSLRMWFPAAIREVIFFLWCIRASIRSLVQYFFTCLLECLSLWGYLVAWALQLNIRVFLMVTNLGLSYQVSRYLIRY